MKNNYKKYDEAGMTNIDSGSLSGFVPEEFGIWAPPPPTVIPGFGKDGVFEKVFLQNAGIKEDPCLVFFVPEDWAISGYKVGWKTKLSDIRDVFKVVFKHDIPDLEMDNIPVDINYQGTCESDQNTHISTIKELNQAGWHIVES